MVLPAVNWLEMALTFTPIRRVKRNCSATSPEESEGLPAIETVPETTATAVPPGRTRGVGEAREERARED